MKNEYEIRGDITIIFLKSKVYGIHECIIDTESLPLLTQNITWHLSKGSTCFYVRSNCSHIKTIHRLIMNVTDKYIQVDHINGNTLDNRKSNLRICQGFENQQNQTRLRSNNTSGIRGVGWSKRNKKYYAALRIKGKNYHFGYFDNKEDAEKAVKYGRSKMMEFSNEFNENHKKVESPYKRKTLMTSGVKYITWRKYNNKWWVRAPDTGRSLGLYHSLEEAKAVMEEYKKGMVK